MYSITSVIRQLSTGALAVASLLLPAWAQGDQDVQSWNQALLDNCSSKNNTSTIGTKWVPYLDNDRGGTSAISWSSTEGTFSVTGTIQPIPGSFGPGTAGMVLPFGKSGEEFDINQWDGIQVTIRNEGAPLLLRIHNAEIANGDHFAAMIPPNSRLTTHTLAFQDLGQVMSPQQPWSGRSASGVELVNFGWTALPFSWEITEIKFYKN